jgi:hypothetical protein
MSRTLALLLTLIWAMPVVAHPPPKMEETESASQMLRKKKRTPYTALAGDSATDKQAYGREGFLDIRALRVTDGDPLVVEVELFEAVEPEPGGLLVFLLAEGDTNFRYAAYLPEEGEWGLFGPSGRNIFEERIGDASYTSDGTTLTVTIPRSAIPLDDFLVHLHTLSGPDNDNLWKDECPNERKGIGVPPRSEEDLAAD